jgi:hypothetical protein
VTFLTRVYIACSDKETYGTGWSGFVHEQNGVFG